MLSHGNLLSNAVMLKDYWGWPGGRRRADPRAADLSRARPVCGHPRRCSTAAMIWHGKFDPRRVVADLPRATVFMGVPTLYVRMLAEPR